MSEIKPDSNHKELEVVYANMADREAGFGFAMAFTGGGAAFLTAPVMAHMAGYELKRFTEAPSITATIIGLSITALATLLANKAYRSSAKHRKLEGYHQAKSEIAEPGQLS